MNVSIDPKSQETELGQWRGAKARIWGFHATFRRIAIFLSKEGNVDGLYIVAISSENICGPVAWDAADISVVTEPPNQWGEIYRRIVDKNAGFELRCRDVIIVRGRQKPPPDPFEAFFEKTDSKGIDPTG